MGLFMATSAAGWLVGMLQLFGISTVQATTGLGQELVTVILRGRRRLSFDRWLRFRHWRRRRRPDLMGTDRQGIALRPNGEEYRVGFSDVLFVAREVLVNLYVR